MIISTPRQVMSTHNGQTKLSLMLPMLRTPHKMPRRINAQSRMLTVLCVSVGGFIQQHRPRLKPQPHMFIDHHRPSSPSSREHILTLTLHTTTVTLFVCSQSSGQHRASYVVLAHHPPDEGLSRKIATALRAAGMDVKEVSVRQSTAATHDVDGMWPCTTGMTLLCSPLINPRQM